jgi:FeS assembly protein IscX
MDDGNVYTWEDSYAIAQALRNRFPEADLDQVSLGMIYQWTLELAGFEDDPQLANQEILTAIYLEWFEEVNPL